MANESYSVDSSAMELNASSDNLTAVIDRIEMAISAYRFGTETLVVVEDGGIIESIAYQKLNGKWGITIDAEGGVGSIRDQRREVRIAAISYIPRLFEEIKVNAAKMREKIEAVLPQAEEFAETLERGVERCDGKR